MDCCRSRVQRLIKIIKKLYTKLLTNNQECGIISTTKREKERGTIQWLTTTSSTMTETTTQQRLTAVSLTQETNREEVQHNEEEH